MVVEPIDSSTLRTSASLDPTFRNLSDALSLDNEFLEEISAAYSRDESPESPDFFDLELTPDGFSGATLEGTLTDDVPNARQVTVSEGTVTFSNSTGSEEVVAAPFHDVRVQRIDEDTVTVVNRTTDRAVRLEQGESLTVSGEGQAELAAGDERSLRLEDGQSVTLTRRDDSLSLKRASFRDSIRLSDGGRTVGVRGDPGSEITLYTGPNESLQFEAGEGGTVDRTDDGAVRITNEQTGESLTLAPTDTLKASGEAEFTLGEDPSFEVEEGDAIRLFSGEDGLEIRNKSVVGSVSLNESVNPDDFGSLPGSVPTRLLGGQARVYGQLLGSPESTLNLPETPPSLRDRLAGASDEVIEPLSERESEELLDGGLTLGEESEDAPFRAERNVSETFQEFPSILGENEETEGERWWDEDSEDEFFFEEER